MERRLSKHKEEFGEGAIEGVAGPEAANNANAAGTLVPLLTLGHPDVGDCGRDPRRLPAVRHPARPAAAKPESALVWGLIASLLIANVILLALNLPLVGLWVKILEIPQALPVRRDHDVRPPRYVRGQRLDVRRGVCSCIGAVGYLMRRFGFPISPMIVGAILGPLAEVQLRRALDIAGGNVLTLVSTPFTIAVYLTLAAALVGGYLLRRRAAREMVLPSAGDHEVEHADEALNPQVQEGP